MLSNFNIYIDIDGVLCIEIAGGYGDAIKLHNIDQCLDFLHNVVNAANEHFDTQIRVPDYVGEFANDVERQKFVNDLARQWSEIRVMALTAQQQFFVEEYLRTFNATNSYMALFLIKK